MPTPRANSPKQKPINGEVGPTLNGRQMSFVKHFIVDGERNQIDQRARIDGAALLGRMRDIALAKMGDVATWSQGNGIQLKASKDIPPGVWAAIKRIGHHSVTLPNGQKKAQCVIEIENRTVQQVKLGERLSLWDGEQRGQPVPV